MKERLVSILLIVSLVLSFVFTGCSSTVPAEESIVATAAEGAISAANKETSENDADENAVTVTMEAFSETNVVENDADTSKTAPVTAQPDAVETEPQTVENAVSSTDAVNPEVPSEIQPPEMEADCRRG